MGYLDAASRPNRILLQANENKKLNRELKMIFGEIYEIFPNRFQRGSVTGGVIAWITASCTAGLTLAILLFARVG
jgi:hypothetical protein